MTRPSFSLPLLEWLPTYRKESLRPDLIAGLTTAAVVIPTAMAYATIAGLSIQVGLYTAFVPLIIYAVLGTSRVLSVSTTTTIAILTGTELAILAPNGNASTLLAIAALLALMVSVATIAGLAAIDRFKPGWPAPLIVIAVAIGAVALFGLQGQGVELVGTIPAGLPSFKVPDMALAHQLWPAALGIALMSFTETIAVGRAFAKSDEAAPRPTQSCWPPAWQTPPARYSGQCRRAAA
jgi:sulfate permease, SulP family